MLSRDVVGFRTILTFDVRQGGAVARPLAGIPATTHICSPVLAYIP